MGMNEPRIIETGVFASPATQQDSPYELIENPDGTMAVRCVQSGASFETSVLANPTYSDVEDQRRAFMREIAAWLATNGPTDPLRDEAASAAVSGALAAEYTQADLGDDQQWIQTHDMSARVPILKTCLDMERRLEMIEFAARIAAVGNGISETDAQFIEYLGAGLELNADVVANTVMQAIHRSQAA